MKLSLTTAVIALFAITSTTTASVCTTALTRDRLVIKTLAPTQNFKDVPVHRVHHQRLDKKIKLERPTLSVV
ncbi:hypothetical protein BGZ96_007903 [Linnemannia gamsii]|uniref:Uncharacterized protein n=1 Tax=Linnemannia gamsii TaxID=64522 RepID=A0ABQ7KF97_9FUNG|nr:hypothetical protein BGZ96_007903 [Linnemannia gamsii]